MDAISVVITESAGVATVASVLGLSFRRVFKMGVARGEERAERAAQRDAQAKAEVRVTELEALVTELEALVRTLQSELDQIRGRRRRA